MVNDLHLQAARSLHDQRLAAALEDRRGREHLGPRPLGRRHPHLRRKPPS